MLSVRSLKVISLKRNLSASSYLLESSPVNFKSLDKKWIAKWKSISKDGVSLYPTKHLNKEKVAKESFYALSMFPYPSGMLHMGHLRVYTISDVIARFKRLQGLHVIHPMGWDAFGLPAENAAIERGIDPSVWTETNIAKMKEQMELMLADFDWEREVNTSSPDYYKWTQKIFLLLYEHGLAYRKNAEINWDPVDKTVLANEQVDSEGRSWRSGAIVEKRNLEQWFIGITKFAPNLNKDLEVLKDWPEKVKSMQKHWIGESRGAEIKFPTDSTRGITVFTSRPDTLFSVQFIALALNHPIVVKEMQNSPELQRFVKENDTKTVATSIGDVSKEGFKLQIKASLPIDVEGNKAATYEVPVYAAPYVIGTYGHGAVMGCPGHDQRDFDFWQLHNPGVPVVCTVGPKKTSTKYDLPYTQTGYLQDNLILKEHGLPSLGRFVGLTSAQAKTKIIKNLHSHKLGSKSIQYRIRDWLVSRQRYWGAPIPIVHCKSCGPVPVPDKDLPLLLPKLSHESGDNKSTFGKGNPLANLSSFVDTKCPSCGSDAMRDTDTMDTFMDSSWYFFRYTDPKNTELPFSKEKASKSMPIDMYIGGVEHAILHLLYSRFILKFLGSIGMWQSPAEFLNEPIKQLVTQGMVHGKTYKDPKTGRFLKPEEIPLVADPLISYEKMSKSKYNGADPSECIEKYGADATRAHMLFLAPISGVLNWKEEQIAGVDRWLRKVIMLGNYISQTSNTKTTTFEATAYKNIELNGKLHDEIAFNETEFQLFESVQSTITQVTKSIESELSFNTIISDYMKLTNSIIAALKTNECSFDLLSDSYKKLLVLMSPVTPSTSEECWEAFQKSQNIEWNTIFSERWPKSQFIESPFVQYNVYVNGRARFVHKGLRTLSTQKDEFVLREILENENGKKYVVGEVKKMIVRPEAISFVCK